MRTLSIAGEPTAAGPALQRDPVNEDRRVALRTGKPTPAATACSRSRHRRCDEPFASRRHRHRGSRTRGTDPGRIALDQAVAAPGSGAEFAHQVRVEGDLERLDVGVSLSSATSVGRCAAISLSAGDRVRVPSARDLNGCGKAIERPQRPATSRATKRVVPDGYGRVHVSTTTWRFHVSTLQRAPGTLRPGRTTGDQLAECNLDQASGRRRWQRGGGRELPRQRAPHEDPGVAAQVWDDIHSDHPVLHREVRRKRAGTMSRQNADHASEPSPPATMSGTTTKSGVMPR